MTSQVHELEDLILLKCPYHLKWSKKKKIWSNLQFQCYSKTPNNIFLQIEKNSEIYVEQQKIQWSLESDQNWKHYIFWFQTTTKL